MAGKRTRAPEAAITIRTYAELGGALGGVADGNFGLVVVLGSPGLGKSQEVKTALGDNQHLFVRGRTTALAFFEDCYFHSDLPIVIDDADNFLSDRLCREYVKILTETDDARQLIWRSSGKHLEQKGIPEMFWTSSPVCILTNTWNSDDALCQAIESRAQFFYFVPSWEEVYRHVGGWFYDQEIFDYVHERLGVLRSPDVRLFIRAYERKVAGIRSLPWQGVIDSHIDDETGLLIRRLLRDSSFRTNTERQLIAKDYGVSRATFYRRLSQIQSLLPAEPVGRIVLTQTSRPIRMRPRNVRLSEEAADSRDIETDDGGGAAAIKVSTYLASSHPDHGLL